MRHASLGQGHACSLQRPRTDGVRLHLTYSMNVRSSSFPHSARMADRRTRLFVGSPAGTRSRRTAVPPARRPPPPLLAAPPCFPGRDDGDLGHGEKTVHEDQEQKKQEFHGNRLEGRSWDELYPASDPIPLGPEEHPRGRDWADRIKTESVEKPRDPERCWLPGQGSSL